MSFFSFEIHIVIKNEVRNLFAQKTCASKDFILDFVELFSILIIQNS
jgi:hypothetical protein